ncbi:helix-turn-helix transcriptional regulator [Microbacterium forte]
MSAPITVLPHASVLASLITPSELAEALGTTERTLSEWRIRGSGPAYLRIGRSVRYVPHDVDSWLLAQQHRSTAEELSA